MLPVLPEGNEQSFHSGRIRNLDVLAVESDHIAHIHSLSVSAAKQLKPSRERDLVFRIRSLECRLSLHHTLLEDHSGNCLHFARQLRADAEACHFRKLSHDLFDSFNCQIAGEVCAQSGQAVGGEEAQAPLSKLRKITRIDAKSFERSPARVS